MTHSPRMHWPLTLVSCLTISRMAAGILSAIAAFSQPGLLPPLLLYILVSDVLDGALARRLNVATRLGGILDYSVDRFNFYLVISILVHKGVSPFLFIPYFLRDFLALSVQAYVALPTIRGTKAASVVSTIGTYTYLLLISHFGFSGFIWDGALLTAFIGSLANMALRVYRLRDKLLKEFTTEAHTIYAHRNARSNS